MARPTTEYADMADSTTDPAAYARSLRVSAGVVYGGAFLTAGLAGQVLVAVTLMAAIPIVVVLLGVADLIDRGGRIR